MRYDILIAEQDQNDEQKTYWTKVGAAFPLRERDGFKLILRKGLSVSGEVLLLPAKAREE